MSNVPRGRFVWYELLTTDPAAAQRFYAQVIDWGNEPFAGSPTPYTIFLNGQRQLGGLMQLPEEAVREGAPPHWLAYIATPSVDDTLEQAKARGSQVFFGPIDIPSVGRMAVLSDPQGAMFAVYTPEGPAPGQDGPAVNGDISWHELATSDQRAAFRFYSELFGWEKTSDFDMGEMGVYQMFGQNGMPYGGIYDKPADMPAPPHWLLYVKVPDIDDAVELVKTNGGQILNGPMEVPGGDRIAQCLDPQGAAFALHASKQA